MMCTVTKYYKCTACSECFMNEDTFFAHTRTWHCKILLCQGQNPDEDQLMGDYLSVEANTDSEQTRIAGQSCPSEEFLNTDSDQTNIAEQSCPSEKLEEKSLISGQDLATVCCTAVKEEPYTTTFNGDNSNEDFDQCGVSAITESSWVQENVSDLNAEMQNDIFSSANIDNSWHCRNPISDTNAVTTVSDDALSSSIINMEIVNSCNFEEMTADFAKFQSENAHEHEQISKTTSSLKTECIEKPVCSSKRFETNHLTSNRPNLKRISRVYNKKPKIYKCDECGKEFHQNSRYWQHVREHKGPTITAHKCNECGTMFTHAAELSSHRKLHETSFKLNVCNVCGSGFHSIEELVQHIMTHTVPGYLSALATRTTGEEIFSKPSYRARRNRIKRHSHSPYECGICQTTFCHPRKLVAHFRYHSSSSYKCEECLVAFQTMAELIRHNKIHAGDKQYKCDVCGAAFVQSGNLLLHKRKHVK